MKRSAHAVSFGVLVCVLSVACRDPQKAFVAYSLREAECRLTGGARRTKELTELGGITRLAGMVFDARDNDLILVGQKQRDADKITLDDFAVALRSVLALREYPLVSLDRTESTAMSGQLGVRFQGGVEDTKFGKDMLEADILLKKLSLGLVPSKSYGVSPYLSLCLDHLQQKYAGAPQTGALPVNEKTRYYYALSHDQLQDSILHSCTGTLGLGVASHGSPQTLADGTRIGSRFWLYPLNPSLAVRDGVAAIQEVGVTCLTEVLYAVIDGKQEPDLTQVRDEIGDEFAGQVSASFWRAAQDHREFRRVKTLFDLVALAKGIDLLTPKPDLNYWLTAYQPGHVPSTRSYGMITSISRTAGPSGQLEFLEVSGGIELDPIVLRLRAGDVTALREAVLRSKPTGGHPLAWQVPLEGWRIPGADPISGDKDEASGRGSANGGFFLDVKLLSIGSAAYNTEAMVSGKHRPMLVGMPAFRGAGVSVSPQPVKVDRRQTGLWGKVLLSRPSDNSLYWDYEIPRKED